MKFSRALEKFLEVELFSEGPAWRAREALTCPHISGKMPFQGSLVVRMELELLEPLWQFGRAADCHATLNHDYSIDIQRRPHYFRTVLSQHKSILSLSGLFPKLSKKKHSWFNYFHFPLYNYLIHVIYHLLEIRNLCISSHHLQANTTTGTLIGEYT